MADRIIGFFLALGGVAGIFITAVQGTESIWTALMFVVLIGYGWSMMTQPGGGDGQQGE